MAKITIDGQQVECRDGINVLQAALEAGLQVPHYCYHPGLSVVASCRLCLMQMKVPNPKTGAMDWSPRLVPSCQTPVREGMEVRFEAAEVEANRVRTMEFYLLNHPLDCPVCDKAGECYLQDYSETFGNATSRMVDQKHKNPKKDIGPRTLLYADRCVFCTRCVRFTDEISGTHELCSVNRGARSEIDVFPGLPLDNPLQGNVVDLCPVGCLLDKQFLFQQRVWLLRSAPSICPGCSTGCAIHVDQNDQRVYRLRPRFNPGVNDWWMCDEGRFGTAYIHDAQRIRQPLLRRGLGERLTPRWDEIPGFVRLRLGEIVRREGGAKIAALLSPFMACEEAWLLAKFMRDVAPEATLAVGPIPMSETDQVFPVGAAPEVSRMDATGSLAARALADKPPVAPGPGTPAGRGAKFTIRREKCPNRRGVEAVIAHAGGTTATLAEFVTQAKAGAYSAAWIVGGYPQAWVTKDLEGAAAKIAFIITQDLFENALTAASTLVLPACAFAERDGSFMNHAGLVQPFSRALDPPEGVQRDGQYLYEIAGYQGVYDAERVRAMMAEEMAVFAELHEARPAPEHFH